MADIGATLREARMRQRIDISEIESETKIRAKYLRALENEEWDLLPGPTYVKSFLRTYAEALGLDGKLLIEEYKLRHERLSDVEMQPIRPPGASREPRRRRRAGSGRGWAVLIVVAGLITALYFLGNSGGSDGGGNDAAVTTPTTSTSTTKKRTSTTRRSSSASRAAARRRRQAAARLVRLRLVPTGPVYVCLKRAGGETVVNGRILQAGSRQPTYRSKRFRLLLGNSEVRLRVNGKTRAVAPTGGILGYEITPPGRMKPLPAANRPACGA
jgi:transcriptional regulator with XRE-family HTH domain